MKSLVTGGAGFIGSHLVERLISMGHKVVVLDNLSTGKRKNLFKVKKNIFFKKVDLSKKNNIEKYFKNVDWVFHLAGSSSIAQSLKFPMKYYENNVQSTINILNATKKNNIKKILFFSTAALYGDPEKLPIKENSKIKISNNYSLSKKMSEEILEHWHKVYNTKSIILRTFNVYGKRCKDDQNEGNVVGIFLKQINKNQPLTVYGNGNQTRDFIYIDDTIDALIKLAKSRIDFGIFNLGSGKKTSINKLVNIIGKKKYKLPAKSHEIKDSVASINKIKKAVKWHPKTDIYQGIKKTFNNLI